ncbi:radical SAM protein [Candidatus Solincola sp.]|nr:radical SAM protein [Actinomycetota bacterium]MDI7251977.1 radical SAM protein [Actinomycetota bacterium]
MKEEKTCRLCGAGSPLVSAFLRLCPSCALREGEGAEELVREAHARTRAPFELPPLPPRAEGGVVCRMCGNRCRMGEGEKGFCGLRMVKDGKLFHLSGTARQGVLEYYYDPLPTNCVAEWVCAGSTERGKFNLAVFLGACSFDCLFCQNSQFRFLTARLAPACTPHELARAADQRTACICYFGGDPSPQMPFALRASELALESRGDGLRICWETNGSMHRGLLRRALDLSLESGGCVKFDLKAFTPSLHRALCGVENSTTLDNFSYAASRIPERPEPPPVIASTLLVPGYVEAEEVGRIASFIASLDPDIPYSLLAFHPQHAMRDLPVTSRRQAEECLAAAREAGLTRLHLGNVHLLR